MRDDDKANRPAALPAGRRSPTTSSGCSAPGGLGRRVLALALYAPLWTYIVLSIIGLAAALILAGLKD
ncbi:MAG: hypothetical protein ACXU82_20715 [Caulobacteraceae bacterium]